MRQNLANGGPRGAKQWCESFQALQAEGFGPMASDVVCDCPDCTCGAPQKFRLRVSGIQSGGEDPCADCGDMDGDYILEHQCSSPCHWVYVGGSSCGGVAWNLAISHDSMDCTRRIHVVADPFKC